MTGDIAMDLSHRQLEMKCLPQQKEWHPRASSSRKNERSRRQASRKQSDDLTIPILFAGVAGELVIPWLVIWLSDVFLFDVPPWSTWLIFGAPLAIGLLAVVAYWAVRALCSMTPAWARAHHSR